MYYNIKSDITVRKYAYFSLSGYRFAILDAILNNSKRSMIPAGYHSDSDSTPLPLQKSAITWFGGIFARLTPLAAGLCRGYCSHEQHALTRRVFIQLLNRFFYGTMWIMGLIINLTTKSTLRT